MKAETRALIDQAKTDCKTATARVTAPLPYRSTKPQATAKWSGLQIQHLQILEGLELGRKRIKTSLLVSHLRRYQRRAQLEKASRLHQRHHLTDLSERITKLRDETGFDETGQAVEPPLQQWEWPSAMPLYHRLILADPGSVTVADLDAAGQAHVMWMCSVELADLDDDGTIRLLSDHVPDQRRYPGAPVSDEDMKKHSANMGSRTEDDLRIVWKALAEGKPVAPIDPARITRMKSKYGIRISCAQLTYQVNRLEKQLRDDECGQKTDEYHGPGCRHMVKYASTGAVLRARKNLLEEGFLVVTDEAYLTRKDHTAIGIPTAYHVPPGAGWHAYAEGAFPRRWHPKPVPGRRRLIGAAA